MLRSLRNGSFKFILLGLLIVYIISVFLLKYFDMVSIDEYDTLSDIGTGVAIAILIFGGISMLFIEDEF